MSQGNIFVYIQRCHNQCWLDKLCISSGNSLVKDKYLYYGSCSCQSLFHSYFIPHFKFVSYYRLTANPRNKTPLQCRVLNCNVILCKLIQLTIDYMKLSVLNKWFFIINLVIQTKNCVARVLNTNVEQIISIYREQEDITQVSNYYFHVYTSSGLQYVRY